MPAWLQANLGSLAVGLILLLVVAGIIRKMIRDRKAGKHLCGGACCSCSGACSGCPMQGTCHEGKKPEKQDLNPTQPQSVRIPQQKGAGTMTKTTLKIDGMMCGMCEAHMNDAIRKAFQVKKVTSSHTKKETEILSENPLDEALIKKTVDAAGYKLEGVTSEPYEKKGFSLFGR